LFSILGLLSNAFILVLGILTNWLLGHGSPGALGDNPNALGASLSVVLIFEVS
jgi:hypothetical protein